MADCAQIQIVKHGGEVKEAFEAAALRALARCGMQAEGYAKDLAPDDAGDLRSSITHAVDSAGMAVYVGTNNDNGPRVELGSGTYGPGGRQEPSAYQDANAQWHMVQGQRAQPFLKPAVADHVQTYRNIIEDEMKHE